MEKPSYLGNLFPNINYGVFLLASKKNKYTKIKVLLVLLETSENCFLSLKEKIKHFFYLMLPFL